MSTVLTLPEPVALPSAAGPKPWRWTREQYYRLGELGFFHGRRVELIRGEIIQLSPIGWPHVVAKSLIVEALQAAFPAGFWFNEQNPFVIPGSEPEPDVAVVPGRARDFSDHPTTAALIVEVADSSLSYDTTVKAGLYAEAGILDYWVLDLNARRLLVFRDPAPLAAGGAGYRSHLTLGPTESVSPLAAPNVVIPVADLLP